MAKTTIIVELVDNKQLKITGPLEYNRKLCIDMLREALKVTENYKGGTLIIPNNKSFIDLDKNLVNNQIRQSL